MKTVVHIPFRFLFPFILLAFGSICHAQSYPFIKNYSPKEYGGHPQNWAIVQDNRGLIYVGNNMGLLEYDGVSWRLIKTNENSTVRSLAKDKKGTIYVGTYADFGFLKPDSLGRLTYQTLKSKIHGEFQEFADIWNIKGLGNKVYFLSYKYLFEYHNDEIKIIKPPQSEFNEIHVVNDTLYVELWKLGLGKLDGDSLKMIYTKNSHEEYLGMPVFLPYDPVNKLGGNTKGLFLLNGSQKSTYKTDVDNYLLNSSLYYGIGLPINQFVFATNSGGAVIVNSKNKCQTILSTESGLVNNTIWNLYSDSLNSLWLATDNGLAHIEYPGPFTTFERFSESTGSIVQLFEYNTDIYLASTNGLFYFKDVPTNDHSPFKIHKIDAIQNQVWSIASIQNDLYIGNKTGFYQIEGQKATLLRQGNSIFILPSTTFKNRIYIGLTDGLASMHYENGVWIDDGRINGISEYINNRIVETSDGDLWIGHYKGVMNVKFSGSFSLNPTITKFDISHGLPDYTDNIVFEIKNNIVFATKKGIYKFDEAKTKFLPDSSFGFQFADGSRGVLTMHEDQVGNIWMYSKNKVGYLSKEKNGSYSWHDTLFNRLSNYDIKTIYSDKNGWVWFGGSDGVFKYDSDVKKTINPPFATLIRKVSTLNDSLLFGGYQSSFSGHEPTLPFNQNNLRFEFALPFFHNESMNSYQHYLEGFDPDWSHWKNETRVDYTNLPEGDYRFRVRSKNIYGQLSQEAHYSFGILPPWYRTVWAYLFYGLISFSIVFLLIKFRSVNLEREKKELERIINERTNEIRQKNEQLALQSDQLRQLDEMKTRFFTNISHEFRTPLTLIKGPAEEMLSHTFHGDPEHAYQLIVKNSSRLLQLVNQILDLSRIDSGNMKLKATRQSLSSFLGFIYHSFSSLAESRNIIFHFIKPSEDITAYFDRDKLEKICNNLLSNAFKFTPENGHITLAFHQISGQDYPEGAVEISVHDSGIGIDPEDLDRIFDRFTQGRQAESARISGSGIGLALTRELVELHHGTIKVASSLAEGTEFDIILPLGNRHLSKDEMMAISPENHSLETRFQYISDFQPDGQVHENRHHDNHSKDQHVILIVEDKAELRQYISGHFENHYEILEAENGRVGLEMAKEHLPDLMICDVLMPEMSGLQLTEVIKQNHLTTHIPIILLTAKTNEEAIIEGLECGADVYMAKPFNARELMVQVKMLIESRAKLREKFKKEFLQEPLTENVKSWDDQFIAKVFDRVHSNLSDPAFNTDTLIRDFALGQKQFTRKLVALTGHTPVQFIRIIRLKKAFQLIKQKTGTISQIAYEVGFNNLSYFSKSFYQLFGKLPSEIS